MKIFEKPVDFENERQRLHNFIESNRRPLRDNVNKTRGFVLDIDIVDPVLLAPIPHLRKRADIE